MNVSFGADLPRANLKTNHLAPNSRSHECTRCYASLQAIHSSRISRSASREGLRSGQDRSRDAVPRSGTGRQECGLPHLLRYLQKGHGSTTWADFELRSNCTEGGAQAVRGEQSSYQLGRLVADPEKRPQAGHFDIYFDALFEEATKDYLDFLRRALPLEL